MKINTRTWRGWGWWAGLGLMLLAALYLRTANLTDVQGFYGDQGRDYMEVMKWARDGHWPLLGPDRAVGDHALGPGWFYLIAPAMVVSGYHLAAGAATVALLATLTIGLIADWVRRTTGSRAAALVTAAVMAFSTLWVDQGRSLWNPHVLPFGVAGLAWLIAVLPRRPVPCLAGALMLMAVLPQWHTTGLLVDAAALPALGWALWRAWPVARSAGRRRWAAWGVVLGAVVALLYVPPILYELKPGPGNLATFFSRTSLPPQPFPGGAGARALAAFNEMVQGTAEQAFVHNRAFLPGPVIPLAGADDQQGFSLNKFFEQPPVRLALAGVIGVAFVMLFGQTLWLAAREAKQQATNNKQQATHSVNNPQSAIRNPQLCSVAYLALLAVGFWWVLFTKGKSVQGYYLIALHPALLLLAGWTAGRLAAAPRVAGARLSAARLGGVALLMLAGTLTLGQLPRAWGVHLAATPYGYTFRVAREVAEYIAHDVGERPFSVELVEPGNFPAHYHYLLNWMGRRPLNTSDYYRHGVTREEMGERIYIIVGPDMNPVPALKGWAGPLPEPAAVRNLYIYRIDSATLPAGTKKLNLGLVLKCPEWTLEAVP